MSTARATRLCPGAIVVDPCWPAYVESSKSVFEVFERCAPVVEPASMEEAFLDVTGAAEPAADIAARLRREVREHAGLPLSVNGCGASGPPPRAGSTRESSGPSGRLPRSASPS